jgi:hypothetical protein
MSDDDKKPCMDINLPLYEKLHDFLKEYQDDVTVNRMTYTEKSLECPAIKAKWTSRYITYQNMSDELQKQLKRKVREASAEIRKQSPVALTPLAVEAKAMEEYPVILALKERVDIVDSLIRETDNILKTVRYLANDLSNIIECIKLEQT